MKGTSKVSKGMPWPLHSIRPPAATGRTFIERVSIDDGAIQRGLCSCETNASVDVSAPPRADEYYDVHEIPTASHSLHLRHGSVWIRDDSASLQHTPRGASTIVILDVPALLWNEHLKVYAKTEAYDLPANLKLSSVLATLWREMT